MMNRLLRRTRGLSILEVLVAVTILMIGIVLIIYFFPQMLVSARVAELRTKAAVLAQMKAEEIRRDDDTSNTLVTAIRNLPTPTDPIVFAQEPDLAYQFAGTTLLYPGETPSGDPEVARVIIRYAPDYRVSINPNKDILYELRFGP